jgi:L-ascorbate metabolism protein UlaG (beta-lactamase superfamily)
MPLQEMSLKRIIPVVACCMLLSACATSLPVDDVAAYPSLAKVQTQKQSGVTVKFLGVTTLVFDDGETAIMTDGFFSRPDYQSLAGKIGPNQSRIEGALKKAGVTSLAAVIPVHSHYDHALDSSVVAARTGALLVGSESSANIARGENFPESRIRVVDDGQTMTFGRFKVTFITSEHLPTKFAPGKISEPLKPPSGVTDYKVGDCFSLLIEHDGRTMLVQGSAGFRPGALKGRHAEVAYLGIGGLNGTKPEYQEQYWKEVVQTVGAKRVIPIHWDNFFKSLDGPLQPERGFDSSMQFLRTHGKSENVDIVMQDTWVRTDPFAGM